MRERCIYGIEAPVNIQNAFMQMLRNSNENKSGRLYTESKIAEIISLTAKELLRTSECTSMDDTNWDKLKKLKKSWKINNITHPPTIHDLSAMLGLNRNKLQSGFKQIYGDTIYGYFRKMRLEYAKKLLEFEQVSVKDVTWHIGYKSVSQFRNAFKNHFGILPSQCKI